MVIFSRPWRDWFVLPGSNPALRAGLLSVVPAGLNDRWSGHAGSLALGLVRLRKSMRTHSRCRLFRALDKQPVLVTFMPGLHPFAGDPLGVERSEERILAKTRSCESRRRTIERPRCFASYHSTGCCGNLQSYDPLHRIWAQVSEIVCLSARPSGSPRW
jgi:hypothetical protein